jgi:hypothetical protein
MEELKEAGWKATENKTVDDIKDIDMKEMFDEADQERRDSQDLVIIPRKVVGFLFIINITFCYSGLYKIQQEHCCKSYWNCQVCKKANWFHEHRFGKT